MGSGSTIVVAVEDAVAKAGCDSAEEHNSFRNEYER
jgi:hypothetical protein